MRLKVPPVVVFVVCLALILIVYFLSEDLSYQFPYRKALSRIFLVIGFFLGVLGVVTFRMKGTTVDPMQPKKASKLVTHGIYQYTRNPMYLGLVFILIGGAIRIGNPLGVLPIMLFIWYMNEFQIKPEEEVLIENFGEDYEAYTRKVRRWL